MNYLKIQKGENHGERGEYYYTNGDYNGVLWCVKISGFEWSFSFMLEGILYLYRLCLFW